MKHVNPQYRTFSRRTLMRLAGLSAAGVAITVAALGDGVLADEDEPVHWTYEGEDGPENWTELDPMANASCSGGLAQSPVDVTATESENLIDPEFAYQPISPLMIVNNGHTVQMNAPAGSTVVIEETPYTLLQFHFHAPSEHTIDGKSQAMELHLVHADDEGNLLVVGLLLREGVENAALKPVFEAMPVKAGPVQEVAGIVDLQLLLPANLATFRYTGSLTTPPCTEDVSWVLFTELADVSPAQIEAFQKIVGANARPVQPLNDRTIEQDTTA